MDEDPSVTRQRESTVLEDVQANAGGWLESGKNLLGQAWRGMDKYPKATKWISFGLALVFGLTWGDKLVDGFFSNFPKMDNFLTRIILKAAMWGGAFLLASKGSDMLANKGAQNRADDEAAERQRREEAKQEWIAQGGNPNEISMSIDAHTNFHVFYREWDKARLEGRKYVVPYSDGGNVVPTRNTFANAANPQQTVVQPPATQSVRQRVYAYPGLGPE